MKKIILLTLVIAMLVIAGIICFLFSNNNNKLINNTNSLSNVENQLSSEEIQEIPNEEPSDEILTTDNEEAEEILNEEPSGELLTANNEDIEENQNILRTEYIANKLSDFDLSFLKQEQSEKNLIYSPLSIKYALKMLEEAAEGEAKKQITNLIGNYTPNKYNNNKYMSLANSLWVRDEFKSSINQSYIDTLNTKYSAELKIDKFTNAKNINKWIEDKTLNIIPKILEDDAVSELDFALINALAIDMEWIEKFTQDRGESTYPSTYYYHENGIDVYDRPFLKMSKFNNSTSDYSVMEIEEVVNNFDIIKEIGEENIKTIVTNDYKSFLGLPYDENASKIYPLGGHGDGGYPIGGGNAEISEEKVDEVLKSYFPGYIEALGENYHKIGNTTDFGAYWDNEIKVFQKNLKTYGGVTLEYIGIMPINEDLQSYVENITADKINDIIFKIRTKPEDFEEGVVTRITGTIPKFKFEYNLELLEDLKNQGITKVFEKGKAELTNMTNNAEAYITGAMHKANIEFTQDGIKAAAVTQLGGAGGGDPYDYFFNVPIKEVDLTFDKPYMFLIRDNEALETWFVGIVYEPLLWENETTNAIGGI